MGVISRGQLAKSTNKDEVDADRRARKVCCMHVWCWWPMNDPALSNAMGNPPLPRVDFLPQRYRCTYCSTVPVARSETCHSARVELDPHP